MSNLWGLKELYDVTIKATYPIEVGNRKIEPGEIILAFDKIQVGGLDEIKTRVDARGGFDNRAHVSWETTKEIIIRFSQGVFSQSHLALLSNSKLATIEPDEQKISITAREKHESDDEGRFYLDHSPSRNLFVYDVETGEKLNYTLDGINEITIQEGYKDVYVTYEYDYTAGGSRINIGQRLVEGYLKLEGKTRLKDDIDGHTVTGIIEIPKLKLMSDLSMRLGDRVDPVMVNFTAAGIPTGSRGNSYVCNFYSLNDDIDSDM